MITLSKWSQNSILATKKWLFSYVEYFQCFLGYFLREKKVPICLKSTKTGKQRHFCDQNVKINMETGGSEVKDPFLTTTKKAK